MTAIAPALPPPPPPPAPAVVVLAPPAVVVALEPTAGVLVVERANELAADAVGTTLLLALVTELASSTGNERTPPGEPSVSLAKMVDEAGENEFDGDRGKLKVGAGIPTSDGDAGAGGTGSGTGNDTGGDEVALSEALLDGVELELLAAVPVALEPGRRMNLGNPRIALTGLSGSVSVSCCSYSSDVCCIISSGESTKLPS